MFGFTRCTIRRPPVFLWTICFQSSVYSIRLRANLIPNKVPYLVRLSQQPISYIPHRSLASQPPFVTPLHILPCEHIIVTVSFSRITQKRPQGILKSFSPLTFLCFSIYPIFRNPISYRAIIPTTPPRNTLKTRLTTIPHPPPLHSNFPPCFTFRIHNNATSRFFRPSASCWVISS